MKQIWLKLSPTGKALVIFVLSFVLCMPLFVLISVFLDADFLSIVASSAVGWFAGGAIVGTYAWYKSKAGSSA